MTQSQQVMASADSALVPIRQQGLGAVAETARVLGEIKAAMELARAMPREEDECRKKIKKECERPGFAEASQWEFKIGGKMMDGPSVDLARGLARCWGHIGYGLRVLEDDGDTQLLEGWARDNQTGVYVSNQSRVKKAIQRRRYGADGEYIGTEWVVPDENQALMLTNKVGAKLVRNALLQLLPSDLVEDALYWCDVTLGAVPSEKEVDALLRGFDKVNVPLETLSEFLGHDPKTLSGKEYRELVKKGKALKDGQVSIAEAFPPKDAPKVEDVATAEADATTPTTLDEVVAKEAKKVSPTETPKTEEPKKEEAPPPKPEDNPFMGSLATEKKESKKKE